MKILSVRAELFHAGGRTDMKLIAVFRKFANSPKEHWSGDCHDQINRPN